MTHHKKSQFDLTNVYSMIQSRPMVGWWGTKWGIHSQNRLRNDPAFWQRRCAAAQPGDKK